MLLITCDGEIQHESGSGEFFEGCLMPALKTPQMIEQLKCQLKQLTAQSSPQIWQLAAGVVICAAPYVERRQVQGILALAAPSASKDCLVSGVGFLLTVLGNRLRHKSLEQEVHSLSTQLSNAYEELSLIDQISSGMRVNRRSADFFRQVCLEVMQVMNVRGMGVALCPDTIHQDPALYGELTLSPDQIQRLGQQLLAVLGTRKSPLIVNAVNEHVDYGWLGGHAAHLIAVPLLRGERVLGCLFGLDKINGDFDSVDSKLLTAIGNESAIYVENAMLYGDVHDLMMGLLRSLTSAVDAKDAYTCGHSERVALLAQYLASKAGLPDAQVERIYMAGLLHDVGKIGIPESVLQKTGRLTTEEFELMKRHCQIGAHILADVKQLEDIVPGVLHHHERYDGRGYPMGLAGHDIPVMGRIICLADCFDAMTSNRTYRRALPLEVALTEIRRCAGTQFDPALAEMLLEIPQDQLQGVLRDPQHQAAKQVMAQAKALAA